MRTCACMFQTFGIITSAFLCRTIRDMQADWDAKCIIRNEGETNFQFPVRLGLRGNQMHYFNVSSEFQRCCSGKSIEGTTIHVIITKHSEEISREIRRNRIPAEFLAESLSLFLRTFGGCNVYCRVL